MGKSVLSSVVCLFFLTISSAQYPIKEQAESLLEKGKQLLNSNQYTPAMQVFDSLLLLTDSSTNLHDSTKLRYHLDYTECLLYNHKFDEAIKATEIGLSRQVEISDPTEKSIADWLNLRGYAYRAQHQYQKADSCYKAASVIYDKQPYSNTVCAFYNNYAVVMSFLFDLERLDEIYAKCYECYAKTARYADYYTSKSAHGKLYLDLGDLEKAEELIHEAENYLEKNQKTFGRGGEYIYYRLEGLYGKRNNPNRALEYSHKALKFCEENYEPDSPETIKAELTLSKRMLFAGQLDSLEATLQRILDFYKKDFANHRRNYAAAMHYLGRYYIEVQQFDQAYAALSEADSLYREINRNKSIKYHFVQIAFSEFYDKQGDYESAASALELAYSNHASVYDSASIGYAVYHHKMGDLLWKQGRYGQAMEHLVRGAAIFKKTLAGEAQFLNESELALHISEYGKWSNLHLRCLDESGGQSPELIRLCFEDAIFEKGFLMFNVQNTRRQVTASPEGKKIQGRLMQLHNIIATSSKTKNFPKERLRAFQKESEDLQTLLAKTVRPSTASEAMTTIEEVAAVLKPNEAAVEFVRFGKESESNVRYAALLLLNGKLRYFPLCTEQALNDILMQNSSTEIGIKKLYGNGNPLYPMIWEPIFKENLPIDSLYFSPAGLLYGIALPMIPDFEGKTIAERLHPILKSSARSLVYPKPQKSMEKRAVLFDALSDGNNPTMDSIQRILIQGNFKTTVHSAKQASVQKAKKIGQNPPSPPLLHFFSHGFFLKKEGDLIPTPSISPESAYRYVEENPMLRNGLLMFDSMQNTGGRLTAYEISQMDLSNTRLAVLSACDSGLGNIQGNEGVYGMQRAFKIADTERIVMALWQVPEWHTEELMLAFYENYANKGMSAREALLSAQLSLRQNGYEPHQWAGFVILE